MEFSLTVSNLLCLLQFAPVDIVTIVLLMLLVHTVYCGIEYFN